MKLYEKNISLVMETKLHMKYFKSIMKDICPSIRIIEGIKVDTNESICTIYSNENSSIEFTTNSEGCAAIKISERVMNNVYVDSFISLEEIFSEIDKLANDELRAEIKSNVNSEDILDYKGAEL